MSQAEISVREITKDTVISIVKLEVSEEQNAFVAPNAISFSQALFQQDEAWFRGIYAGDEPVGFAMFSLEEGEPQAYLWRYMIDHRQQGKGYGRRALELLIEEMRSRGHSGVLLSFVDKPGSPEPFYAKLGFERTGKIVHGETEMLLPLSES